MRKYVVTTRTRGVYIVRARSRRHAVARLVARLALDERQAEEVVRWSVAGEEGRE